MMKDMKHWLEHINLSGDTFWEKYLKTSARRMEFILCILLYVLMTYCLISTIFPDSVKGFIAQIQSFVAIIFAIRFRFLGFYTILTLNLVECIIIFSKFISTYNFNLIIGISLKAFTIISTLIVAKLIYRQEVHKRKLHDLAVRDELTNVYNRRYFYLELSREMDLALKSNDCVGLILIDIDNFKMINDIHGHNFGDTVLRTTAQLLRNAVQNKGTLFRYGGDEFAISLLRDKACKIEEIAQEIKNSFESQKNEQDWHHINRFLTLSMGLSIISGQSGTMEDLISQADIALYHAKNLGKDRIHFYQDVLMQLKKSISNDHQQLIGIFKALLSSISAKDKYTLGHSERVSSYVVAIGTRLGLPLSDIAVLQYAGLLHDIGKIEIPKSILNKVERLTDEESEIIPKHPEYSANILEPLEGMEQLIDFVKHHHERIDGKGYPDGLKGSEISLGARILCVADSFDAMISDRPYSKGLSVDQAVEELQKCSGTQFDPEIVNTFVYTLKSNTAPQTQDCYRAKNEAAAAYSLVS